MDDLAQSTLGYDVALALWLGLMTYFASLEQGRGSYGFARMGFTVPILTLGNVEAPLNTFDTAVSRCSEPILGVGCAYVSTVLVAHGTQVIRCDSANAIEATAQDCAAWMRLAMKYRIAEAESASAVFLSVMGSVITMGIFIALTS